ncbi:MAG TPA: alpha/beta hydrolase, partial [Synechococcus sp. UBA9887]|nr:alpha/beta hydrolase [Synechococcus sp. UBA9887]
RLISRHYLQPRNLVVRFGSDGLDQSEELIPALNQRSDDATVFQQ